MRRLRFLIFICVFVGCDNINVVNDRALYWKNELETLVPIGTPKEHALRLIQEVDPTASENLFSGHIYSNLEILESDSLSCKNWAITGTTTITNNIVYEHSIASVGRCL